MTKKAGPCSVIRKKKRGSFVFLVFSIFSLVVIMSQESFAVPAFARKYHTACSTCHIAFPARNGFGEAFRNNGYRFPNAADDEMVKEEPIKLGQDAYKDIFPNAIWPSDLPNMPSLGFLGSTTISQAKDRGTGKYQDVAIDEEIGVFFAGTITHQISYFGDFALNSDAASLGRLVMVWAFQPGLNFALGDVGFPEIFTTVSARASGDKDSYSTSLPNPNRGLELRLAGDTGTCGGYSLLAGVGRQSPPGHDAEGVERTGSLTDTRYARGTLKLGGNGLLSGVGGTIGINEIGLDNSVTFGANVYNSDKGGEPASADFREGVVVGRCKTAYSGDITANYGHFRAVAQYAKFNEVLEGGVDYGQRNALSLEGTYWVYPWLYGVLRYERIQDNLNGKVSKIIPGVAALLRPNAKIGLEYVTVTKDAIAEGFDADGVPLSSAANSLTFFAQLGF
jgi:hypothetical protein